MPIMSYSQNFEDVLLQRALGHVDHGFYIDVGAADPVIHSVTKALYDKGWSGVNVEPVEASWLRLEEERPRDVNLKVAVGSMTGTATLHVDESWTDISTLDADALRGAGRHPSTLREVQVPVWTMSDICDRFARPQIHFLKIDVEGLELDVLQGCDFDRFRPWLIVVEVQSLGKSSDLEGIHRVMNDAGYSDVYYDGLNRFYISQERREELAPSFTEPVSVKDDFVIAAVETEQAALSRLAGILGTESARSEEIIERVVRLMSDYFDTARDARAASSNLEKSLRLADELELAYQETYELSRHIAGLTIERDNANLVQESAVREVQELKEQLRTMNQTIDSMAGSRDELSKTMDEIMVSRSWRLTSPLRRASEHLGQRLQHP